MREYNLAHRLLLMVLVSLLFTGSAWAGGWHKIGTFAASKEAKEMAVNRNVDKLLIKVKEGSVIINTVVVRQGDAKTPHKVGARIEAGRQQELSLGDGTYVNGLRISDDGQGLYDVFVK